MKTVFLSIPALLLVLILNVCLTAPLSAEASNQKSTPVLYYDPGCSHCHKVMDYAERNNVRLIKKNIRDSSYRSELKGLGANSVPVMVVDSKVIRGSSPIISYLRSNY